MGKQKEKYMVLQEVSKDWLESHGAERKVRRIWKPVAIALFLILIGISITFNVEVGISSDIVGYIVMTLLLCIYFMSAISIWRAGKRYFKEVKDKEQPILLEKMPSWWSNK